MNLIIFSGPPSSGKTSVILKTVEALKSQGMSVGVVKFDCLYTDDDKLYAKAGIPVKKGFQELYAQTISLYQISRKSCNGETALGFQY